MTSKRPTISKLADAIRPTLIKGLANKPVALTKHQIQTEIQNREIVDQHMRLERQRSLDEMFPNRASGSIYRPAPVVEFDF